MEYVHAKVSMNFNIYPGSSLAELECLGIFLGMSENGYELTLMFLVGVFEEEARLLQWLVSFVSSTRWIHLFCSFVQLLGREVNPDFLGSEKQESVGSSLALNHKSFMLPKVEGRPEGRPSRFFSELCDIFPKIFEFYQRVPSCIFLKF